MKFNDNAKRLVHMIGLICAVLTVDSAYAACPGATVSNYTRPECLTEASGPGANDLLFGYVLNDNKNDPNADNSVFLNEIQTHANAVAFNFYPNRPNQTVSLIAGLASSKLKGVVFVNEVFVGPDNSFLPEADVSRNLIALANNLRGNSNIIYLALDEPMWREQQRECGGNSACLFSGPQSNVADMMKPIIERWADRLRTAVPQASIFVVEPGPMIRKESVRLAGKTVIRKKMELPANIDVYAFDCYGNFDACSSDMPDGKTSSKDYSIPDLFMTLQGMVMELNKSNGGFRKLGVVPPTMLAFNPSNLKPGVSPGAITVNGGLETADALMPLFESSDQQLRATIDRYATNVSYYMSQATKDPSYPTIRLIGGFGWNTLVDGGGNTFFGVRGLPISRSKLIQIGQGITGRSTPTAGSAPIIEFNVTSNLHTGQGMVWSWSTDNDTSSCQSLSGDVKGVANGVIFGYASPTPGSFSYTIQCKNPYGTANKTVSWQVK